MTKNILCILAAIGTILLLTVLDSRGQLSITGNAAFTGAAGIGAVASGGCTPATGNVTNETFGASPTLTWTTVSGSPDLNYSLPGTSPCSGLGSVGARANATTGEDIISRAPIGTAVDTATLYHRFYVYVASESLANNDDCAIYQCSETTTITSFPRLRVWVSKSGAGQLQLYADSVTLSSAVAISAATWYRVELMSVNNNTTSEVKVFDSAGSQVGSTATFQTGNYYSRFLYIGRHQDDNANATDVTIDGVGISTSGYLGQ